MNRVRPRWSFLFETINCVGVSSPSSREYSHFWVISIVLHCFAPPPPPVAGVRERAEQTTAVGARPAGVRMWEAVVPCVTLLRGPHSGSRSICVGVWTNHVGGF